MNWVERRLVRENALNTGGPEIWNKLRSSMQDACETYNNHCSHAPNRQVKYELENCKRFRVKKTIRTIHSSSSHRDDCFFVIASFESAPPHIDVTGEGPVQSSAIPICSNEETVFFGSLEKPTDVEEISRRILEPLLFPTGQYRDVS